MVIILVRYCLPRGATKWSRLASWTIHRWAACLCSAWRCLVSSCRAWIALSLAVSSLFSQMHITEAAPMVAITTTIGCDVGDDVDAFWPGILDAGAGSRIPCVPSDARCWFPATLEARSEDAMKSSIARIAWKDGNNQYTRVHLNGLRRQTDGLLCGRIGPARSTVERVLVAPSWGFGNRLRMTASAAVLASTVLGLDRPVEIVWEPDFYCGASWEDIFQTEDTPLLLAERTAVNEMIEGISRRSSAGRGVMTNTGIVPCYCGCEIDKIEDSLLRHIELKKPRILILNGGFDCKVPEMDENEYLAKKHAFYSHLQPNPDVAAHLAVLIDRLPASNTEHKINLARSCIGIHLRSFVPAHDQADRSFGGSRFEEDSPDKEFVRFALLAAREIQPAPHCFLVIGNHASATARVAKKLREALARARGMLLGNRAIKVVTPGLILEPTSAVVSTMGEVDMYNTAEASNAKAARSRMEATGMQQAIAEFFLLSRTRLILGTYSSSFSDEAAVLGGRVKICVLSAKERTTRETYHTYGLSWGALGSRLWRAYLGSDEALESEGKARSAVLVNNPQNMRPRGS